MKKQLQSWMAATVLSASLTMGAMQPVTIWAEGMTEVPALITDDAFITGADVSSYAAETDSGVVFYNWEGESLDEAGFFAFLAENGVNYIRLRVWNDPFDENGNGYGGGNCDIQAAIRMGKAATEAGMKVLIDFHYSDFWADPGKQQAPKAWAEMSLEEKETAIAVYTAESLATLKETGVNVGMVQIGNETTAGFCGESEWPNICSLFSSAAGAVREFSDETQIVIHMTNPEKEGSYAWLASVLDENAVDYDIFASSYYPYWHGTPENLTEVLKQVAETYGKKVMVAETSWAYTAEDGDGHGNTINESNISDLPYEISVSGQCAEMCDVVNAVLQVGEAGIGVFYWEPAWIPVKYAYQEDKSADANQIEENKAIWENFGSGWASSFAGGYDAEDAGQWFGGSAVDNQAWFDFEGKPLESVGIYQALRTGIGDQTQISLENLPGKVKKAEEEIIEESQEVSENLIANGDFENGLEGWELANDLMNTNDASSNSYEGNGCLHFWTPDEGTESSAAQTVTLAQGTYSCSVYLQGGNSSDRDQLGMTVKVGEKEYTVNGTVTSWKQWSTLQIDEIEVPDDQTDVTITLFFADSTAGVWGAFDEVTLQKIS